MTQSATRKDLELDHFLHPARAFRTPMDVVAAAILASWASDACAVEAAPVLRRPPSAPLVRFDDVMDALKQQSLLTAVFGFFSRFTVQLDLYRSDDGRRPAFA